MQYTHTHTHTQKACSYTPFLFYIVFFILYYISISLIDIGDKDYENYMVSKKLKKLKKNNYIVIYIVIVI